MPRHTFPAKATLDLEQATKLRRRTVADHGFAQTFSDIIGSASDRRSA